jgi:hypothetical protein
MQVRDDKNVEDMNGSRFSSYHALPQLGVPPLATQKIQANPGGVQR